MTDAVSQTGLNAGLGAVSTPDKTAAREAARDAFQKAIGNTFYRQMMKSLRESTSKAAYVHGGQAEDIFQSQLDEILIERMSAANGGEFSDRLFEQQFPQFRDVSTAATSDALATSRTLPTSPASPGERDPSELNPSELNPSSALRQLSDEERQADADRRTLEGGNLSSFSVDL